jgi:hypothetical protein
MYYNSYGSVSEGRDAMSLALLFAIIASIMALSRIVVIYRALKEKVRAGSVDPVSWFIWGGLGVMTLVPQIVDAGWQPALLFGAANVVVNAAIVWLARKHGIKFTRKDVITIGVVAGSVALCVLSGNAFLGLMISLLADFVGVARTWRKAWRDPDSERAMTWLLAASAGGSAVISAVYAGEMINLLYPVYAIGNALMSAVIVVGRRKYLERKAARLALLSEAE